MPPSTATYQCACQRRGKVQTKTKERDPRRAARTVAPRDSSHEKSSCCAALPQLLTTRMITASTVRRCTPNSSLSRLSIAGHIGPWNTPKMAVPTHIVAIDPPPCTVFEPTCTTPSASSAPTLLIASRFADFTRQRVGEVMTAAPRREPVKKPQ